MASHREESMSLLRFPNRQLPSRECCARNAQLDKVVDYTRKVCVRQNPAAPCLDVLTVGFGDIYSLLTTMRGNHT